MSGLALAAHQFRFDQKTFWRNPASVFFTVMLPVIFLLIFATIFGNDRIDELGGETGEQDQPEAEHDVARVPELNGSVDHRLHLKKFANAVKEEKQHGKQAER